MDHLFLEGPIQTGKSTLLRRLLAPYLDQIGGFTSQRLLNRNGDTVAFRIGPAATTPLTAPFSPDLNGIFRISEKDGSVKKFPEVFDQEGVSYLMQNQEKKLILLDEIGGAELLSPFFRRSLDQLLSRQTPCIGVIKLEEKALFMSQTANYTKSVVDHNRELRQKIKEQYNGRILFFDGTSSNCQQITKEIEDFLCGIFTTN